MSKEIVVQPQPRAWLEDSVLQPFVSRYGAHLRRGRYAPSTQRIYLCCIDLFARIVAMRVVSPLFQRFSRSGCR